MSKVNFGPSTFVFPEPVFLVGANIDGKPNFMTAAWGGMACGAPPMLTIAIRHQRYTLKGIKETGNFSVNIPDKQMVKEADYCGLVSGFKDDKVKTCGFNIFYGKLENAPMIDECPINMECKAVHMLNLGSHMLVIGSIEETHVTEKCLTGGKPDLEKIKPMLYSSGVSPKYYSYGGSIADAFNIGNAVKNVKQ
jgi:flavin reductase (DIM6/NTAB) family NADH-FMN oxidoreductase RutF